MQRNVILLALLSVTITCFSGCILSSKPATSTVTLKVGEAQTFSVTGFMNGPYTWSKNDVPINGVTGASYTYTALATDKGTFVLKAQTSDLLSKKPLVKQWTVTVTQNLPPIAVAGDDQLIATLHTAHLDGSGSSDPEGQALTYHWILKTRPEGSNAALSNPDIVNPTLIPDVPGAYEVILIVSDGLNNMADTVAINAFIGNRPPTANAGADAEIFWGATAALDGSGSSDPDGNTLAYAWRIVTIPEGSTTATISNPTSDKPTFLPDIKGTYTLGLIVNDGEFDSVEDTITITVTNRTPIANAGPDGTVDLIAGETYTLNGSGYDPDDNPLTYAWTIKSAPEGSAATLNDASLANPTFKPDRKGAYVFTLTVSDGDLSSTDEVTIATSNHIPIANANTDIAISYGSTVLLTGSLSSDPDDDLLTYAWTVAKRPDLSTAEIVNPTTKEPTFKPDVKGTYEIQLIVSDGEYNSAPDTMTITTRNDPPIANAGADLEIHFPGARQLNGSATDQNGDPLTFRWSIKSKPVESLAPVEALLSDITSATPTFMPDVKGHYELALVANDGELDSMDTVAVDVYNNAPSAHAGAAQSVFFGYGASVQLDGSGSDVDNDPLSFAWTIVDKPGASTAAVISDPTILNPTFTPDARGAYTLQLVVSDGDLSGTATVVVTAYNDAPIANAGPDQDGYVNTLVTLNGSGTDPNGYAVNYTWSIVSVPSGSAVIALSNPYLPNPTFTPDMKGQYVFSLVVDDGIVSSDPNTVTINVVNRAPVANAGTYQPVHYSSRTNFQLNGSGSYDLDGDALTYAWSLSRPSGSSATITNPTSVTPTITLDVPGTYTISLVVNDGTVNSTTSTVNLTTSATVLLNEGWEDGNLAPWTESSSGIWGAYKGIKTDRPHTGSYSYRAHGGGGVNSLRITYTLPGGTYVTSVSFWHNGYAGGIWSNLNFDFYADGKLVLDNPLGSNEDTWYQTTQVFNRVVTSIAFQYTNYVAGDNMFVDDIVINVWD